jgi:hypothetical protein
MALGFPRLAWCYYRTAIFPSEKESRQNNIVIRTR